MSFLGLLAAQHGAEACCLGGAEARARACSTAAACWGGAGPAAQRRCRRAHARRPCAPHYRTCLRHDMGRMRSPGIMSALLMPTIRCPPPFLLSCGVATPHFRLRLRALLQAHCGVCSTETLLSMRLGCVCSGGPRREGVPAAPGGGWQRFSRGPARRARAAAALRRAQLGPQV